MAIDPQLADMLSRWEDARQRGETVTPEELCGACPERLAEVREQIDKLARMDRFLDTKTRTKFTELTDVHLADWEESLSIGSQFSGVRFFARGGLGTVCVAYDERLHREVALKFIDEAHAAIPESLRQFLVEAEVTGRLEHPGVVPMYGLGQTTSGRPFYAMRFIQGETLDAAIQRFHGGQATGEQPLKRHQLLARFVSVCNTIAYAHNRGIVHRDIKPANIMLGRYNETVILDWGLAMPVGRDERARASGERTLLPEAGKSGSQSSSATAGTPPYMSPEQAAGQGTIGPASDVYSLGATLYKLLTGQAPYSGASAAEVLLLVQRGEFTRPSAIKTDIPTDLEAICLKAMAVEPQSRYPSALALAEDIEHHLADEPVSVCPEGPIARSGRWFRHHRAVALTGILALVSVLVISLLSSFRSRQQAQGELTARLAAEQAQDRSLVLASQFAARSVASVVETIARIVEMEALDLELRTALDEIDSGKATADEHRDKLEHWLNARFLKHDQAMHAAAWFLTDAHGTQVVRSPPSSETEGQSFAGRDYFHGLGREIPKDETQAKPPTAITASHVSRPYRSKATGDLMIAFSTPVWSGRPRAAGSRVLGVLATTVKANRFDVLQLGAEDEQQEIVVLVDLREDWLEETSRRGLILHHQNLSRVRPDPSRRSDLVRVSAETVGRLLDLHRGGGLQSWIQRPYLDPVGGDWMAAFAPVLVLEGSRDSDTANESNDLQWGVLVQRRGTTAQ